jgi:16S rRNA (cytosine1402-N4)-methyltransferase
MPNRHISVMVNEVIDYLGCSPGKTYVDGTLGGGGHAQAILRLIGPKGLLIGVDRDPDAIAWARDALQKFHSNVQLFNDNYTRLPHILAQAGRKGVDGIVLDLGLSLYQLEGSGRGFSFMRDEPLDMRMNPEDPHSAEDMVNRFSEKDLAHLLARYGEEPWAKRIAKAIVRVRRNGRITSSLQLAEIVKEAIPAKYRSRRIHPATRTFQALRIAVNRELEGLEAFLNQAVGLLNPRGRLCVLSFHSLEDRIVKQRFKAMARGCDCPPDFPVCVCGKRPQVAILTRKPVAPDPAEVASNPMARSAKLRAVERLEGGAHE